MGGFSNAVIGGATKLIRQAIQSPNYLTGVSGWTINRDGTVEFNAGTFRATLILSGGAGGPALLVYNGVPANGNLLLAIAPQAGQDTLGNGWGQGLTLPAIGSVNFKLAGLNTGANLLADIIANAFRLQIATHNGADIAFDPDSVVGARVLFEFLGNALGVKFGNGPTGKYHSEVVSLTAAAGIASGGALKPFTGFTSRVVDSDYGGTQFSISAGSVIFTAPDDGWYTLTLRNEYLAWLSGSVTRIGMTYAGGIAVAPYTSGGLMNTEVPSTNAGRITDSICVKLLKNDTITPSCFQNTGAVQTPDGGIVYMSVVRHL